MARLTKRQKAAKAVIERDRKYDIPEAVELVKASAQTRKTA